MKRIAALLLAGTLTLSLAACGMEQNGTEKMQSVSSIEASNTVRSPEPTPLATVDTEKTAANTALDSDISYTELEERIETETENSIDELAAEWEVLASKVVDYSTYLENKEEIDAFYSKVYELAASLCVKMRNYSVEYAEAVLASGKSAMDMYEDLEGIYDLIYDDMGDKIFDGIYDGILDDMYDGLYNGALDDKPDDVEYSDWFDARDDEYDMWSDMRSETYDQWSEFRSDVYDFWSDVRSEVYKKDTEGAQDEITDFIKDIEKVSGKLLPTDDAEAKAEATSTPEPEETAAETPTPEPEGDEGDTAGAPLTGIRPEFQAAMDSYEAFYDEYCTLLEQYQEDPTDFGVLTQYTEMMSRIAEMDEAFEAWDDEEMSNEELAYYLEVSARIQQRLAKMIAN